jgi:hypothetical protein
MRMADYRLVLAGISFHGLKHRDHARLVIGHLQGSIPELVGSPVRAPLAGVPVEPRGSGMRQLSMHGGIRAL